MHARTAILGAAFLALATTLHAAQCPVVPPPGLVSWWPGEGNALDVVGANHGIPINTIGYGGGVCCSAFEMDSTLPSGPGHIEVPYSSSLRIGLDPFSFAVWVNPTAINDRDYLVHRREASGILELEFRIGSDIGDQLVFFQTNDIFDSQVAVTLIGPGTHKVEANRWTHLVAVRDDAGLRMYFDGVDIAFEAGGPANVDYDSNLRLGRSVIGGSPHPFDGTLDDIQYYDRALSAAEVLALFNSYSTASPMVYCTAGTSISGCTPEIWSSGLASTSAASGFCLSATNVEGSKDGLFFYGTNGRQANPWGNGSSFQCVIPPVKRGGLLVGVGSPGGCDGIFLQDLNARWCPSCPKPAHNPGPGAVVQAQLWYRDPGTTANQTTSLSDAVEFTVGP